MIWKVYLFRKFIQYNIHWNKTQMLKKFLQTKKEKRYKKALFFFCKLQLITVLVLLLIRNSDTRFISLKLCVRISIFDSVSFLLMFVFLLRKKDWLFDFKTYNSFQNRINRKGTDSFAPRPLIWNKKFENSIISGFARPL